MDSSERELTGDGANAATDLSLWVLHCEQGQRLKVVGEGESEALRIRSFPLSVKSGITSSSVPKMAVTISAMLLLSAVLRSTLLWLHFFALSLQCSRGHT